MKGGEIAVKVNQVLLGLVMLIPGLYKLFVLGPSAVVAMLESFGFPVALLFAWLLIVSEIFFGAAVLIGWKLKYTTLVPAVILVLAGLLAYRNDYPSLLLHFVTASNFVAFGMMHKK
ncbi:MAG: hypothetical protein QT08_C0013G0027 [archaeon GW2011_AR17]|nr:MAG: hypothetical protein QT08_C0013G0027 [archaeon GW2011_AR17]MBS3153869.1 DoxX family protein [Candidatus Woesearchaeota archaeon]HIH15470.1 DoxX family protein [Nanoarchaeota archaeon]HIH59273.1 DoxX family protein [Nanoarchaeota archaeon]HII13932.1 DoxX family protein [Nanoarchaeota archaeon]